MKRFTVVNEGYNMEEVNRFIDIVIKRLEKLNNENIVEEARNNANAIVHEALLNAEKTEHEAMLLKKNITVYKNRVKNIIKSQLEIAEDLDKYDLDK